MRFTIEQYGWFKEVLKCMHGFETVCTNSISAISTVRADAGDACIFLDRFSGGLMALHVSLNAELLFTVNTWFNSLQVPSASMHYVNMKLISIDYCAPVPSDVDIIKDRFSKNRVNVKLSYPLQDDQYFQKLTMTDLPSEDDINKFISISSEILPDADKIYRFTFNSGEGMDKINETNQEIVVQSVMDAMNRLLDVEKQRIEQVGFLDDLFEP